MGFGALSGAATEKSICCQAAFGKLYVLAGYSRPFKNNNKKSYWYNGDLADGTARNIPSLCALHQGCLSAGSFALQIHVMGSSP